MNWRSSSEKPESFHQAHFITNDGVWSGYYYRGEDRWIAHSMAARYSDAEVLAWIPQSELIADYEQSKEQTA